MTAAETLFAEAGSGPYEATRTHLSKRWVRDRLDVAYARVRRLLPESKDQFLSEFRRDVHARAWELNLLDALLELGESLERPPPKGPDIRIRNGDGTSLWIECERSSTMRDRIVAITACSLADY